MNCTAVYDGLRKVIFNDLQLILQTLHFFADTSVEESLIECLDPVFDDPADSFLRVIGGVTFSKMLFSGKSDFQETPRTRAKKMT